MSNPGKETASGLPVLKLFCHSFGFRFHYKYRAGFDVFAFIHKAAEMGFSGVNISAFPPDYPFLNGIGHAHVDAIRRRIEDAGLLIDIETSGTDPDYLARHVELAARLGAGHLRTYTRPQPGGAQEQVAKAIEGLRVAGPLARKAGIRLLIENHEDLAASEVAQILGQVGANDLGVLFDYGNSMLFMEEPLVSLAHLRGRIRTAHLKDHVVLPSGMVGNDQPLWVGVPIGCGSLPVLETSLALLRSGVERICFENCWAYQASFRDRRGQAQMGEGAFAYLRPPYDPAICLPDAADAESMGKLDFVALETDAINRSVVWLRDNFDAAGIRLARGLRPVA